MSGARRIPSDTLRLDQAEIAKAMAEAEAEADVADPVPEAPETQRICPSCDADPDRAASCVWCKGDGTVTIEQWREWKIANPTGHL